MAQHYKIQYIDDLDGTELGTEANSISFAFEGKEYSIDLSDENAERFREVMEPYMKVATRVSGGRAKPARKAQSKSSSGGTKAIRDWARENGYTVSDRGRIPADVVEAYTQAN